MMKSSSPFAMIRKICVAVMAMAVMASAVVVDGFMVTPSPTSPMTSGTSISTTNTRLQMGLLDFFSEDARREREEKKRKLVEEQERLQKAIMERRKNPELMEKYEQQVSIRREMKMKGDFDAASKIDQYEGVEDLTLLDGSKGST